MSDGGYVYESDLVHLGVVHPLTGRVGTWRTPTSEVATACRESWEVRPRRCRAIEFVTCDACKSTPVYQVLKDMR